MRESHKKAFASLLRTAAQAVEEARKLAVDNQSTFNRLGWLADELRFVADAFAGDVHGKA